MNYVLTLIADPARPVLDPSIAAKVAEALGSAGFHTGEPDFLAPGIACDIPIQGQGPKGAEAMARQAVGSTSLDIAVQLQHGRKKKLLACDMDATLIENEIVDEIAAVAGLRDQIAPITARSVAGDIDFLTSLKERVALLKGLPMARYLEAKNAIRFVPGGKSLIATMRANGAHTMIISGGFRAFTSSVRDALGMDEDAANDVEITGGALTGKLVSPVVGREQKAEILRRAALRLGLDISETMAVGDGANDAGMIAASGLGVAFRAKPTLKSVAAAVIDHGDLTALLYLQGYRREEIQS